MVTEKVWRERAQNLQDRRKSSPKKPDLSLYEKIVSLVYIGETVLDVGCGQCYLEKCLPKGVGYIGVDPFPMSKKVAKVKAEDLNTPADTVFMLAALDNVQNVEKTLNNLETCALKNVVILTGINIDPDEFHTHRIERKTLVKILGEPDQEFELLPKVFLFEWNYDPESKRERLRKLQP